MSDEASIAKAVAKMEAEAERLEAEKLRERQRLKRVAPEPKPVKNRLEEIDQQNKQHHKEQVEKLKFRGIFTLVSCGAMLIYILSLSETQRAVLVEDTIIWALAGGIVIVGLLKR